MKDKRSFFERLTGSINLREDNYDYKNDEGPEARHAYFENQTNFYETEAETAAFKNLKKTEQNEEGHLTVDCYKTPHSVVIQSIVAGVKQDDLDVIIARDMITIKGKRMRPNSTSHDDFLYQELYWGNFTRSVMLPEEIDIESAEANLKNGILTITLPKLDKNRTHKMKIKND